METTWIRFAAVSSTSLGASKGPSVNTVRESRGLAQAPGRGGEGAKCQLLSLAPWVRQGRGEGSEGSGGGRDRDINVWGRLCPSLVGAEDGLWS